MSPSPTGCRNERDARTAGLVDPERVVGLLESDVPSVDADPPYLTVRGFERAVETDEGDTERRGFRVDDEGERPRMRTSSWAKDYGVRA